MDSNHSVMPSQTPVRRLMKTSDRRDLADWVLMEGIVADAWRQKNKRPPKSGRAVDRFSPSPAKLRLLGRRLRRNDARRAGLLGLGLLGGHGLVDPIIR